MRERLGAELGHGPVVGDRAQHAGDRAAQLLDLGPRLLDVGDGVDRLGAVLDLLVELGIAFLEFLDLLRELLDGSYRVRGGRAGRAIIRLGDSGPAERRAEDEQRRGEQKNRGLATDFQQ